VWHSTFSVPAQFFLGGWVQVQVLQPSEIATWMILQLLSQAYLNRHAESGLGAGPGPDRLRVLPN
jgi:hypothetical protein